MQQLVIKRIKERNYANMIVVLIEIKPQSTAQNTNHQSNYS